MAKKDSVSVHERRFTLLTRLVEGPATIDDIKRIPVYTDFGTESALMRTIERDIETLRASGHNVVNRGAEDDYRYRLDTSGNISVDGTGIDLTLLHHLLANKGASQAEVFAQSGVTKLLSTGSVTGQSSPYSLHIPSGESVTVMASAIQLKKRVVFTYESASTTEPATYMLEPRRLEVHYGSFYIRGYQIEKNGDKTVQGIRVFKLDRIHGEVEITDDDSTHDVSETESEYLAPVTVRVAVDDERLPLAMKGEILGRDAAGEITVEISGITRADLYDDLVFHAGHARIVSPNEVARDFQRHLNHLAAIGGDDGH